jgi:hypothetical protein
MCVQNSSRHACALICPPSHWSGRAAPLLHHGLRPYQACWAADAAACPRARTSAAATRPPQRCWSARRCCPAPRPRRSPSRTRTSPLPHLSPRRAPQTSGSASALLCMVRFAHLLRSYQHAVLSSVIAIWGLSGASIAHGMRPAVRRSRNVRDFARKQSHTLWCCST